MNDCTFCKLARNEIPRVVVYEDELVLAIISKESVAPGHTLLIPKKHYETIFKIDHATFSHFSKVLKNVSTQVVKDNNATGINILHASGKDAQQSVMHLHFHLVPRYSNDGLDLWIREGL